MAKAQVFRLQDFSGGYNPDVSPQLIQDNQAVSIQNFRLDQMGSLVSRGGYTPWFDATPDQVLAMGALIAPSAIESSMVAVALDTGDIVLADGTTSTSAGRFVAPGAPDVGKPEFMAAQDRMFLSSGVDRPVSLSLSEAATSLGIAAPSATPSVTASNGGSLSVGVYKYVFTAYRTADGRESNPSPSISGTTSGSNLKLSFSLPAATTGYKYRVYRTDVDSVSLVYKYLGEFDGGVTVTDDGSTTTSDLAPPVDHDVPVYLEHLAFYNGRYFGSRGDKLYWSYPLNYDYWPALNVTTVPFNGNDTIQALVAFQDALLIFGRRNTLLCTGAQDDNSVMGSWQVVRLDTDIGLSSPRAVAEIGNQLLFLADTGLHVYPGFSPFAPHIQRELTTTLYAAKTNAILGYVPQERSVWLVLNDKTYVIYIPNQAVSFYTLVPTALLTGGRRGNDPPLFTLLGSAQIYEYGGETDDGNSIQVTWASKMFQIGSPESVKFFRRIGAFASKGAGANVTITIRDRGEMFTVSLSQVSGLGESVWNEFNWNEATWAGSGLAYFIAALPAQRLLGRNLQVEIRAEVTQRTEIAPPISLLYREANRFLGA